MTNIIPTSLEDIPDKEILLPGNVKYNRKKEMVKIIEEIRGKKAPSKLVEQTKTCLRSIGEEKSLNALEERDRRIVGKFLYRFGDVLTEETKKNFLELAENFFSNEEALQCSSALKEYWNPTLWHTIRVAAFPILMKEDYGLSDKDIEILFKTSLRHCNGKIAVPKIVYNKKGHLTKEELEILKPGHIENASVISCESGILNPNEQEYKIVVEHHENEDGSGYPRGLKKREINDLTYMLKIWDVFDALTNPRVYRHGTVSSKTAADYIHIHSLHREWTKQYFIERVNSKELTELLEKDQEYKDKIMFKRKDTEIFLKFIKKLRKND